MKKSLCIVLSALMIVLSFAACNGKDKDKESETKLNSDGQAYVEVTEENGEAKTDKDGKTVTSVLSDKEKSKRDKTSTKSSGAAAGTTAGKTNNTQSSSPIDDLVAGKDDLLPSGVETGKKTTLRDDVIADAFSSKKFTLVTSIVSGSNKVPATIAFDNDNIVASLSYDFMGTGSTMKCRLIMKDGYTYLTFDDMKMYMKMEGGDFEGIGSITDLGDNQTYVKTTTVKEGNTSYTCEEYKNNDDGTTSKYYFVGKEWKRLEVIDGSDIFVYEISSFSKNVDSSLFSLSGLKEMDMNAMGNIAAQ